MKLFKRYMILLAGLLIMAFGVAFSIIADLGTSPISSLPYVTGRISGLTVGTTTILMHICFIFIQMALLRRNYQWIQLLQLPVALVFGLMIDGALWCVGGLPVTNYPVQWLYCVAGILLVGIGVAMEVKAGVVVLAGEGLVLAVCQVTHWPFPRTKISFDTTLVVISIVLSMLFLHGLYGVREGTVAAALLVGTVAKLVRKPINRIF